MQIGFDLRRIFCEWNLNFFGGELPIPEVRYNHRLKTSAGRFIPTSEGAIIEIAGYLMTEIDGEALVRDTLGHEMIHFWLWQLGRPYGHTSEFRAKMEALGVSRYNSVPRHRAFKHCYSCKSCDQKIFVRKRLKLAACADCCNRFAEGKYHPEFTLRLLASDEQVLSLVAEATARAG